MSSIMRGTLKEQHSIGHPMITDRGYDYPDFFFFLRQFVYELCSSDITFILTLVGFSCVSPVILKLHRFFVLDLLILLLHIYYVYAMYLRCCLGEIIFSRYAQHGSTPWKKYHKVRPRWCELEMLVQSREELS